MLITEMSYQHIFWLSLASEDYTLARFMVQDGQTSELNSPNESLKKRRSAFSAEYSDL